MVLRHNQQQDIFIDLCHKANFGVKVEAGSTLAPDLSRSHPADALVNNWMGGIPAAFDVTVTSQLIPVLLHEASVMARTAARLAEQRKHQANDPQVSHFLDGTAFLLLWKLWNWCFVARQAFSNLASHLSFGLGYHRANTLVGLYGRLNVALVQCNARALLCRAHNLV